jgi:fructokinase
MSIICLGEIILDMFPAEFGRPLSEVTAFLPAPGGACANVAVGCARLGMPSAFLGKVGQDAFGQHLIAVLKQEGVDTCGMQSDPKARTTLNFMAQPDAHRTECLFYRNPDNDMLVHAGELSATLFAEARFLHFGGVSLSTDTSRGGTMDALRLAKKAGALVSFDVNYRPTQWPSPEFARREMLAVAPQVSVIKANETEMALLTGETRPEVGAEALRRFGPELAVITLGPAGSYARTARGEASAPGFAVETVDATGCGDAFVAALLSKLAALADWRGAFSSNGLHELLRYANAAGALTATKRGVIPALPRSADVASFLSRQKE